jgi:hypothetical protein
MSKNDILIDDSDPVALFGSTFGHVPNTNIIFEAVAINHIEEAVTFKVTSRRFDIYANPLPDIESFVTISAKGITGGAVGSGVVQIHGDGSYSVGLYDELGIDLLPDKLKLNKDYNLFSVGDSFHLNITPPLNNSDRLSLRATGPGGDELYYVLDSSFQNGELELPYLNIDTSANGDIYNATFKIKFTALPYPHGNLYKEFTLAANGSTTTETVNIRADMEIVYDFERKYNTFGDVYKTMNFPQTLTLHQRELSTTVVFYENDTFNDFVSKLNYAIAFGLDNAKYLNNSINELAVLADGKAGTPEAVGLFVPIDNGLIWSYNSTIVIRSAIPGEDGIIHFSGDEEFLRTFGLNVIQEAQEPIFNISVSDAHDGTTIARRKNKRKHRSWDSKREY